MADDPAKDPAAGAADAPDLSSLKDLDFGPSWAEGKPNRSGKPKPGSKPGGKEGGGSGRGREGVGKRRDGGGGKRADGEGGKTRDRQPRRSGGERAAGGGRKEAETFTPTVDVKLFPEDDAFNALVRRLQASARTYQLFEITRLLLEKPERFIVEVTNKPGADGGVAPLFYAVPDHLPFPTEEAAVRHVLARHLESFFEVTPVEVEPPKGNFQMVHRCGVTGELLGPPNHHSYQQRLRAHFEERIRDMPYERFVSKIETLKDRESIDAWVESMKRGARYTEREPVGETAQVFEDLASAKRFLLSHRRGEVVASADSVRFAGRDLHRLPEGDIRRSVEAYVEHQRKFPLESANNIRGRLRRHKFTVYKKGTKGISYVCAVKRKFRDSRTVFSDSIQGLIEFLEKNPGIPASRVPEAYLGIATEKTKPEALGMETGGGGVGETGAETPQPVTPADGAEADGATVGTAGAPDGGDRSETPPADMASGEATVPQTENAERAAATRVNLREALPEEERRRLKQLMLDLRWLITEGYVTEYGDGTLFAPGPMPEPKKAGKDRKASKPTGNAGAAPEEGATPGDPAAAADEAGSHGAGVSTNLAGQKDASGDSAMSGEESTMGETGNVPGEVPGSGGAEPASGDAGAESSERERGD